MICSGSLTSAREAESRVRSTLENGLRDADREREADKAAVESRYTAARTTAQAEFDAQRRATQDRYERERDAAQHEYKGLRHEVESSHARVLQSAEIEQKESSWETLAVFDAIKGRPRERMLDAVRRIKASQAELATLESDALAILQMRRQSPGATSPPHPSIPTGRFSDQSAPGTDPVDAALAEVQNQTTAVRSAVLELFQQRLPRLFEDTYLLLPPLVAWLLALVPCGFLFTWPAWWLWLPVSAGVALIAWAGLVLWAYPRVRKQTGSQYQVIRDRLADARGAIELATIAAQDRARRETDALVSQRDLELATVRQKHDSTREEKERWKEAEITQASNVFPTRLAQLRHWYEEETTAADRKLSGSLATLASARDQQLTEQSLKYEERRSAIREAHDREWLTLAERWSAGYAAIRSAWADVVAQCERLFPDWNRTDEQTWPRPTETPTAIGFGNVRLDLANIKNGISHDERLRPASTSAVLPALMTLKDHPVMVLTVEEEGRRAATDLLQATMLRFLTAMPPGKVRFTILDPVGLGENFGSFMHLADYDELLVSSRIWTEPRQIEEQLTRLTAHMETVLQKYLRNEFATIDEYNAQAGEVAEPFQVLVVANFPANFTEAAARKLMSIVTSGPRCGVYTLISVDRKLAPAHGLPPRRADRRRRASRLAAERAAFPLAVSGVRAIAAHARSPARGRSLQRRRPRCRRGGQERDARRSAVRDRRPARRRALDRRFEPGVGGPHRQGRGDAVAVGATRPRHVAALARRRQDGLRQIDVPARADHQRRAPLLAGPGRVLPDRLQEGRRVQDLCHAPPAARPRDRHRKRARVRPERARAARRRAPPPRRIVSRLPACRTSPATAAARPDERCRACSW